MRRIAAFAAALLVAAAASPAHADTQSATTSLGVLTVAIPDATWLTDDCLHVPATYTLAAAPGVRWEADLNTGTIQTFAYDGSGPESVQVCPSSDGSGTHTVAGIVTLTAADGTTAAAPITVTFTVNKFPTTTTLTKATRGGRVIGTVSNRANGTVVIERLARGKWREWDTTFAQAGAFTGWGSHLAKGTKVRATFEESPVGLGSTSAARKVS